MARLGIAVALVAVVVVALATVSIDGRPVRANDIAEFETVFATDVASAGFGGMRGIGTGDITLSGVSGTVTGALLYWHGPTDSDDAAVNADVTFAGTGITGANIGFSDNNCWGFDNSQAYRANVTSLVPGNGSYSLSDFLKADADINGVSLVVFFDDGDNANNRDVVLFDGNDSNINNAFDADGWNVSLPGINYDTGTASMDLHVSDGQTFPDDELVLNGTITLAPTGPIFDGDSVPNGASAAGTNGGLWDIKPFDVTSGLTPGDNTLTLTSGVASDCLSLIVAAVNLPAGAAPDQPTPTPTATPTSAGITLTPASATNTVGEDHTVTATVNDGNPVVGAEVTFKVTGQNDDEGTKTADADGKATFSYTGDGGAGTDTIEACFVPEETPAPLPPTGEPTATSTATPTVTPTATPTATPTGTPVATPTTTTATQSRPGSPEALVMAGIGVARIGPAQAQQAQESCATATKEWTAVVAAAVQLPTTGSTPSDGGSSALPWLAAIAGAIALIGSGSAWFAYQRRRVR